MRKFISTQELERCTECREQIHAREVVIAIDDVDCYSGSPIFTYYFHASCWEKEDLW